MNFLLPHIRRMPEKLARDQFAADAAQKLGIDSAVLREELRQAALQAARPRGGARHGADRGGAGAAAGAGHHRSRSTSRRGGWRPRPLRSNQPGLSILARFRRCRRWPAAQASDPMDVVEDAAQRALLAEALLGETRPPGGDEVESALQEIQERAIESRLRDLRALIAEAERRGDYAELALLTQQKLELDRALRQLHSQQAAGTVGLAALGSTG